MDGLGLVGRISGVGRTTARVILLTDATSRIPVTVQPSGQKAMLSGDNSACPAAGVSGKPRTGAPRRPGGQLRRWRGVSGRASGRAGGAGQRPAAAGAAGGRLRAAGFPARAAQPCRRTDHRRRRADRAARCSGGRPRRGRRCRAAGAPRPEAAMVDPHPSRSAWSARRAVLARGGWRCCSCGMLPLERRCRRAGPGRT